MPSCRDIEENLAAYVDGAGGLDPAAVDAHLQACPPCRSLAVAERAAHDLLCTRRQHLRGCAPAHLRGRCAAHAAVPARRGILIGRPWVSVSVAASLLLVAGLFFVFAWGSSVETYAAQLAVDHMKCFQFPPDPSATADAGLMGRTWQKANGWSLRVAATSPGEPLQLVGIRRCGSTRGRVAHIFYKWRDQPLSVYVLNSRLEHAAQSDPDHAQYDSVARFGENEVIWTERGRTYAVVAKAPLPDLQHVAGYVRRAVE
jgi:hypothetical protein